ncbi:YtxH domain-containing protein [Nocardioides sp. MAH-18]|uniref:YtxH domain-containing protein n=1 Tax=Nocardioides agri TaxID=2682843 RepID=A0A6L6XQ98_9ACTN|nr:MULTISPECIES: YtxH domain-containing protein [unclassified Nocardioides]MBA2954602.1 YtxH domain-containing protein [Nocardioides sp. CGMCC 1.13656]MVQ49459.1 YtxH domain-containing protein [Nocardioides sp. MAH-18]
MAKLKMLVAFGAGYVLGSRAGRERYEQIVDKAQGVWHDPRVQRKASQAQGVVQEKASQAGDVIAEKAGHAASQAGNAVKDKLPGGDSSPTPTTTTSTTSSTSSPAASGR